MDFFAHQDRARSKSWQLVLFFIAAICAVICSVYLGAILIFVYADQEAALSGAQFDWFNGELFMIISGVTLAIVIIGSVSKLYSLSKGGSYVAESLGGRLLSGGAADKYERRLLNVVEEMSIASGVPLPQVYILDDEESINAFAAGYSPSDAVIGVTKGCCRLLSRDELQGVIAHEFSHILNGDMKLNIQLIGGLAGIMGISQIGRVILRGSGRRSHRSSRSKDGNGIMLFALLLLVIGYIGVFFGRLIQSAISRQREFLADASSVQFTRNPKGLAGALKKIGGFTCGSSIESAAASETCHMFFGKAISSYFSTHPPLPERILRIDPSFDGSFPSITGPSPLTPDAAEAISSLGGGIHRRKDDQIKCQASEVIDRVGNLSVDSVEHSAEILAAIPPVIMDEMKDILGAWSVVCALLLDKDSKIRAIQHEALAKSAPAGLIRQIGRVYSYVGQLDWRLRLPVLDLSLPSLRQMSPGQHEEFLVSIDILIKADRKITIFEFAVKTIISHRLNNALKRPKEKVRFRNINRLSGEIAGLLSLLSVGGHTERETSEKAFDAGRSVLPLKEGLLLFNAAVTPPAIEDALTSLSSASTAIKKMVLDACSHCVLYDGHVSISEAELLRAVAYAMDIPLPPFINREID